LQPNFEKGHMQEDLVSVIMPTFNCSKHLADSIDSILNQTYKNVELIITDDNSTDEKTLSLLHHYIEKDKRVDVLFLDSNKGPGYTRDKSIERARGRYIAFCDSDDCWFKDKLERQIRFLTERQCALTYSSYILIDDDGREVGFNTAPAYMTFNKLKCDNKIGCSTAIYDIKMLGKKYFMPHIRKRQDWGLFLTIMRDYQKKVYAIQEPLVYYRMRSQSVSSNKFGLIKYNIRIYREVLGFSKLKSLFYFFFIFMPTYLVKIAKRGIDSFIFLHKKKTSA